MKSWVWWMQACYRIIRVHQRIAGRSVMELHQRILPENERRGIKLSKSVLEIHFLNCHERISHLRLSWFQLKPGAQCHYITTEFDESCRVWGLPVLNTFCDIKTFSPIIPTTFISRRHCCVNPASCEALACPIIHNIPKTIYPETN